MKHVNSTSIHSNLSYNIRYKSNVLNVFYVYSIHPLLQPFFFRLTTIILISTLLFLVLIMNACSTLERSSSRQQKNYVYLDNGTHTNFYANGKIKYKGNYNQRGQKHGWWIYKVSKIEYRNGKLIDKRKL